MSGQLAVLAIPVVTAVALLAATVRSRLLRLAARTRLERHASLPRAHRSGLRVLVDVVERRRSARSTRPTPGAIAAVLDQIARHCSSGESLGEAFLASVAASPLVGSFAPATAALRTGEAVGDALDRLVIDHADFALAVHALRLCASQGGNVSESLDRAAATLRERDAVARERLAQSSQAQLSARVLTVLPIAFGGWTLLTTTSVQQFFLTPIGLACLLLGLGLNAAGWLLMRRVTRGLT